MPTQQRPWLLIFGSAVIILSIAAFAVFQLSVQKLKGQVEKTLGPYGEVRGIRVGLNGLEIMGIRIRAPRPEKTSELRIQWPAEDQLRAERILIAPSLIDLLSARVVLRTIRIEGAYLSMLRTKNGRMQVLPSLFAPPESSVKPANKDTEEEVLPGTQIKIGTIELIDSNIDFFDASIRKTPLKLRLERINANVRNLQLPELKGQSEVNLDGVLKGVRQDGKIAINGTIELASRESELSIRLRGVDLVTLQPYLIKASESGVQKGILDLDLKPTIRKGRLNAPGTLTLGGLELASSSNYGTLMGMPRDAALAMMKDHDGKISVKFMLEGDINDPRFSLNETLSTRIGISLAKALGISIEGLTTGVGVIGRGAAKGISDSLDKLLNK